MQNLKQAKNCDGLKIMERGASKKRPKNSTFKPLSTIFVPF